MGWSSGTQVFIDSWSEVRRFIPEYYRVEACAKMIDAFEKYDWDCVDEIFDEFDEAKAAYRFLKKARRCSKKK